MIHPIFDILVFPGFLFTAIVGMVAHWIERKVTARIHYRVGPPILQPIYDLFKLLGKENTVPKGGAKWSFILSPFFGLAAITLTSTIIWIFMIKPNSSFVGDLIVVINTEKDLRFRRKGEHLYRDINVTIPDAVFGTKVDVPTLVGEVEVKIPAGTQPGTTMRIPNEGLPGFRSGRRGDIYLNIKVEIPKKPSKEEKKLFKELQELYDKK